MRPPGGRVDVICERTRYDDGSTLPVVPYPGTDIAVRRRPDGLLRTTARELDATDTRPIDALRPAEEPERPRYVAGAAALLRDRRGNLPGAGASFLRSAASRPTICEKRSLLSKSSLPPTISPPSACP